MLETLCILASVGSALKVTGWIFLGIIGFYVILMTLDHFCGLEGMIKFFATIFVLFWGFVIFAVIFLIILGIQALAGV